MNWPIVTLLDSLASAEVFVDGDWVESKDQDPKGDVRLIQLADVGDGEYTSKSNRFLTSAKARELRCTFLRSGDVLVARMPDPLGRACIFPGDSKPSVTVVDVCIIRPASQEHDARWLMHCLNAPDCRNQIAGYATGTTRSRISRGNLAKIRIPLPPLPEQRRIAEILDKADALRAKRRAALAQLDALTQSIFLDMFGDPATNPRGWPVKPLRELGEIFTGKTPPTKNDGMFCGDIPFATPGDLDSGLETTQRSITRVGTAFTRTVRAGSALVGCIGNIGKMAKTPVATAFNQQINAVEWGKDIDDEYGIAALSFTVSQMLARSSSTTVPILNKTGFSQVMIPAPPLALQRGYAQCILSARSFRDTERASLERLEALFGALQHRAFRGEL